MKLISVTSGKGGVGKTTVISNLAMSLSQKGSRVLILDGDIGMSNVDIFFGVRAQKTIKDIINGMPIDQCITPLLKNIDLLSGGSGLQELMNLNAYERREIIDQIRSIEFKYDFLLIDTAPGIHDYVLHLNSIVDECIILITQDPSSFTDAYALVKTLHQKHKMSDFLVVCNLVEGTTGISLFTKFSDICEKFLDVNMMFLGTIPQDAVLRKLQQHQRLVLKQNMASEAQKQINNIGLKLIDRFNKNKSVEYNDMQASDRSLSESGLDRLFFPVPGHA